LGIAIVRTDQWFRAAIKRLLPHVGRIAVKTKLLGRDDSHDFFQEIVRRQHHPLRQPQFPMCFPSNSLNEKVGFSLDSLHFIHCDALENGQSRTDCSCACVADIRRLSGFLRN